MKDRDKKLVSGFLSQGFEFNGVTYKPLTARTLLLLEKANSPFFHGGGTQLKGLLDFLFVSSNDSKTVLNAINSESWEETIMDFADSFTSEDLTNLGNMVNESNENVSAALVEVRETGTNKKK